MCWGQKTTEVLSKTKKLSIPESPTVDFTKIYIYMYRYIEMSDCDCFYGIIIKGEGLTLELKGFSQGWLVQLINVKAPGKEGVVYLSLLACHGRK